jgi:hypothetical protein
MKEGIITPVAVDNRQVPDSDHWHVEDGYLNVYDSDNERVATYAPGAWQKVTFVRSGAA